MTAVETATQPAHSSNLRNYALVTAAYSLNSEKWQNVFPVDSLFDSAREELHIELKDLSPGMYVLVVRVTDASGQTGSDDVVFELK